MIFTSEQRIAAFRSGEFILDTESEQAQGLRGWWPLGVHGGVARDWDYSIFNNHGVHTTGLANITVNNPRWGAIRTPDFDGVSDRVTLGDLPIFEVPVGITVSAWVRPSISEQVDFSTIVAKEYASGPRSAPFISWKLAGHAGSGVNLYRFETGHNTGGLERNHATSTTVPTANVWVHLLGTWDGVTTRLYVNGVEEGTDNTFNTDIIYSDGQLLFAANGDLAEKWEGQIKDVRFYNRAFSAGEAFTSFNNPWEIVSPLGLLSSSLPLLALVEPIVCDDGITTTFKMSAPYPASQTTSLLPSPRFADGEAPTLSVSATRAMDGTLRTYVKTKNGRRKLTWSFLLTRHKALEIREFVRVYFASQVEVTDHNNRRWVGNFTNNPFEFVGEGRANPAPDSLARGEYTTIQLEFEGIEQV